MNTPNTTAAQSEPTTDLSPSSVSSVRSPLSSLCNSSQPPLDLFYPYQRAWLADPSQFKIGLWARQTGKDYTCAAEAVFDSINTANNHWLIIACGERQARESLQHAKFWAEFLGAKVSFSKTEIRFRNGSRITALPAKPETIRGYSANLILTEFAFHDHPDQIWRAVFPILTNPLKAGPRKLRIISTPNGHSNLFHKLWSTDTIPNPNLPSSSPSLAPVIDPSSALSVPPPSVPSVSLFFRSRVTIHDAVRDGLPIDIPLLQRGLADTEAFAQEYNCEFLDQSSVLLPYELIQSCESPEALETSTPQILSTYSSDLYIGIDFARKHDLTVAWTLERISTPNLSSSSPFPLLTPVQNSPSSSTQHSSPVREAAHKLSPVLASTNHSFLTREVLILPNCSTPDQLEHLAPRIQRARRVALDYTGPGIGLGDLLVRHFGETRRFTPNAFHPGSGASGKIELCTFTQSLKHELFSHLRSAFERRILSIPSSSAIREDLHSIQRSVSHNGQLSYRASHTPDGHSDRATALALALRAAESAPVTACASNVGRRFAYDTRLPRHRR